MTKAYFNIEGTLGSQPPWGTLLGARLAGCRELSVAFSTPTLIDLPHSSQPAAGGGGGDQSRRQAGPTGALGGGQGSGQALSVTLLFLQTQPRSSQGPPGSRPERARASAPPRGPPPCRAGVSRSLSCTLDPVCHCLLTRPFPPVLPAEKPQYRCPLQAGVGGLREV